MEYILQRLDVSGGHVHLWPLSEIPKVDSVLVHFIRLQKTSMQLYQEAHSSWSKTSPSLMQAFLAGQKWKLVQY